MTPSKSGGWQFLPLIFLLLGVYVLARPTMAADDASQVDLICHTSNPTDCYPRVFQPTEHFQAIRDGQSIPPGLHVRLNMHTGKKEARLDVPGEDAPDVSLLGIPVDSALVVVESETAGEQHGDEREGGNTEKSKGAAPAYDPVGRIKPPPTANGPFDGALNLVRGLGFKNEGSVDDALEALRDIAHDMYYGLKIAEDTEAVKSLLCLAVSPPPPPQQDMVEAAAADIGVLPRDQEAAYILAGALQNNPAALEAVAQAWDELMEHRCEQDGRSGARLDGRIYAGLAVSSSSSPAAAAHAKARASAINGLIKSASIRAHFLARGGMQHLLRVMREDGPGWEGAQRRVGQLALDNFLDGDMGADMDAWPTEAPLADWYCRRPATGESEDPDEACWQYHAGRLAKKFAKMDDGAWSRELFEKLDKVARTGGGGHKVKPARADL